MAITAIVGISRKMATLAAPIIAVKRQRWQRWQAVIFGGVVFFATLLANLSQRNLATM